MWLVLPSTSGVLDYWREMVYSYVVCEICTLLKSICTSLQPHPQHWSVTATRCAPSQSDATTLHLQLKYSLYTILETLRHYVLSIIAGKSPAGTRCRIQYKSPTLTFCALTYAQLRESMWTQCVWTSVATHPLWYAREWWLVVTKWTKMKCLQ